jgi:hypothetical protein
MPQSRRRSVLLPAVVTDDPESPPLLDLEGDVPERPDVPHAMRLGAEPANGRIEEGRRDVGADSIALRDGFDGEGDHHASEGVDEVVRLSPVNPIGEREDAGAYRGASDATEAQRRLRGSSEIQRPLPDAHASLASGRNAGMLCWTRCR